MRYGAPEEKAISKASVKMLHCICQRTLRKNIELIREFCGALGI